MSGPLKRVEALSPAQRATLAARLAQKRREGRSDRIPKRANEGPARLSYAQQRLWFLDQLEPGSPAYNLAAALRLRGPLSVEALGESLGEVVRRHEILRSYFPAQGVQPVQVCLPEFRVTRDSESLESLPASEREAATERIATEEARYVFTLSRAPLFRARLLRLGAEDHCLLLTFHHIVADGWSIGVLVKEVAALYAARLKGEPSPLPPLVIQYSDFSEWQFARLQGAVRERDLAYWKNRLRTGQPILELPVDRPRPATRTSTGQHVWFELPENLAEGVRTLCEREAVSPHNLMLAAFFVLLSRYSGQEDVCVGIPAANRGRRELEGLIGFFVNSLAITAEVSSGETFREFLQRMQETVLEGEAHQELPFDMLVEELKLPRNLSHSPLFDVMFGFQRALLAEHSSRKALPGGRPSTARENFHGTPLPQREPLSELESAGLQVQLMLPENGTAKFDLLLMMEEERERLRGYLEYSTDLFERDTIARMAEHYQALLESAVANPAERVADLRIMTEAERRKVVLDWNECGRPYPRDCTVPELFEQWAERTPDAVAIVDPDGQLTYRELNRHANRLAYRLRRLGAGLETPVGVCLERSADLVVAILAILKAGAIYVPLDPEYPAERLSWMLEDCGARFLIASSDLAAGLPSFAGPVLSCRTEEPLPEGSEANPSTGAGGHNLAYIIYTSGSTCTPKGSAITHRAISRLVVNTDYIALGAGDRVAQVANASFDAITFELWGPLLNGATVVVIPRDVVLSLRGFPEELRRQRIDVLVLTTSLFNQIAIQVPGAFEPVRELLVGGEAQDANTVRYVLRNRPPRRFVNVYGPTETTTFASTSLVRDLPEASTNVPIGRPIANTQVYILDVHWQPIPIRVPGELCIGGDGLARCYWRRPDLTAEKFIPNPFGSSPGERLYRSGDRARFLPDGNIEFLGRFDEQVKIRGFRIEPGEIEAALRQHPLVRQASVQVREPRPGDKRLVAYIVAGTDRTVGAHDLRRHLQDRLPEYLIPQAFVVMDALPLNPNGKVDREALPAPEWGQTDRERPFIVPRTRLERFVAGIWREVLGVESIGVYDNFFELGGNSIQAAMVVNRLEEELVRRAPVRALFMAPTVAELAVYLHEYYAEEVAQRFPEEAAPPLPVEVGERMKSQEGSRRVDADMVERLRSIIPPLAPRPASCAVRAEKNPPALFVLSPPRSGSTLLRAMLAGNPRLFSPPELDLLEFNTLGERKATFSGEFAFWLEGPIRALMEIHGWDAGAARRYMEELEQRDLPVKECYRLLQDSIGPERLLVDKTPVYPLDARTLDRAEEDFDQPYYIHLVRHPYASVYSFLEAKLEKMFFRWPHPFSLRELAELVWIVCHENILRFLAGIPAGRQLRVTYEELVSRPQPAMEAICGFLGIPYAEAMLLPYEGRRMTDGIEAGKQMVGDYKFYLRNKIDTSAAGRWKKFHREDFLSDIGWRLARTLGYEREEAPKEASEPVAGIAHQEIPRASREAELPLSHAQQRLWFLDQLEPGTPVYNVPAAVRLTGSLDVNALRLSLREIVRRHEVLRTRFEAVDGRAVQVVEHCPDIPLPVIDLAGWPEGTRETEARRRVKEEVQRPFDLGRAPLVRGCLLRLSPDDHIAVITLHHIAADGWSAGVLLRELTALYTAFARAEPSPLPELAIQYADFAAWQRSWLEGEIVQQQLEYWRRQLGGRVPALNLPIDRPRPAVQSWRGATHWFRLDPALVEDLRRFARAENRTLFMTLLAGFQALLHRYTGQEDICVGTPVANRTHVKLEGLIGFFVNTLVMRVELRGELTFRELVERVRPVAEEAYANQDIPFERLVDELEPSRDLSRSALFDVMFGLQNVPMRPLELPGLTVQRVELDTGSAKFDLTMLLHERGEQLNGVVEYNTDLFDADTIERLIGHYQVLLRGALHTPDQPLSRLPLLTPPEQRRLLIDWNANARPYEAGETFVSLFDRQAEITPDRVAVRAGGQELTYRELRRRGNQLAHALRKLGVGPESPAGLCLERSVDLIVGLLGILKAGGAYVPLDPGYPQDRLSFMLRDSGARVLVTRAGLQQSLQGHAAAVLCVDRDAEEIAREGTAAPVTGLSAGNLAYVIFTSGSTGQPKGVMIEHRQVLNLSAALEQMSGEREFGRPLSGSLNAPLSFDASVQQLVMLLRGHTLCLIPDEMRRDGAALKDFLRSNRIDWFDCVPSQLKLLLEEGLLAGEWSPPVVLPGGEAIDAETWKALAGAEQAEFYNVYGPTECTVDSTSCRARAVPDRPSIGRGLPNVQLYVLDRALEPVPVGVAGELYIAGAGVGRGYWNQPSLTAERFLPCPFSGQASARMYKTGDLVRYRADGNLEFLGRVDFQVKIRGYRIELGEIEECLRQHEGVRDAAVVAREDGGARRLVAYWVAVAEPAPAPADLRAYLARSLPDYMAPSVFVKLPAFPQTASGKVDRQALPEPEAQRPDLEEGFAEPRTPAERTLAAIWKDLLRINKAGIRDNFFHLGGDSILSIQMIARAAREGLRLTPKQVFLTPTIERLAATAETAPAVDAEQGVVTGPAPLTPIQHRFFESWSEVNHFNQSVLLEARTPITPASMEVALQALLAHHDALRLRFEPAGEGWRQWNAGADSCPPFECMDLREFTPDEQRRAIEVKAAATQSALDIVHGPLLRVVWFELGENAPARLLVVAHHLAVDAVSWRVLMEDIVSACMQAGRGERIQLPPKTTSYKAWAQRLVEEAESPELRQEMEHWGALRGAAPVALLRDRAGEENLEASARNVRMALDAAETEALLKEVPRVYHTEINDALAAALAEALAGWTGQRHALIDMEGHGRDAVPRGCDVTRTVGWFTSIYPVRIELPGSTDPGALLRAVKEQMRAVPRHGTGYGLLRYLCSDRAIREQMAALPKAEVIFNYLGQYDQTFGEKGIFRVAGEAAGVERSPNGRRSHVLEVTASVAGGKLNVDWRYSGQMHREETIRLAAGQFLESLRRIIRHCQSPEAGGFTPSDFPEAELSQSEIDELIQELG